jgi:hypothetical protein
VFRVSVTPSPGKNGAYYNAAAAALANERTSEFLNQQLRQSSVGLDSLKSDADCVARCFGRVSGTAIIQLKLSRASCPETPLTQYLGKRKAS